MARGSRDGGGGGATAEMIELYSMVGERSRPVRQRIMHAVFVGAPITGTGGRG
jgi:hypothetical protein